MDPIERKARLIVIGQLMKSVLLIVISCVVVVGLSLYMYGLWQAMTGLGWPLFLVAEVAAVVAAYFLGLLPATDQLIATLRGGETTDEDE